MRRPLIFILFLIVIPAVFFSCKNKSADVEQSPQIAYASPVTQPLKTGIKKLDGSKIKTITVHPQVKKFDLDKLPVSSYDSAGFKPFKYPIEKKTFDLGALPENDLDIDKLPSTPLKFVTKKLPPPKLIKSGLPNLKNATLFLYQLGRDEGFEQRFVTAVLTDAYGFIWIATGNGLYRYDGSNLLLYMALDFNHFILSMAEDTFGRFWAVSGGSLVVLDPKERTLKSADKSSGLGASPLFTMLFDRQQRIWLVSGTGNGIAIVDTKIKTVKWLNKAHHLVNNIILSLAQDSNNNVWIGGYKGLEIVDPEHKKIKYLDRSKGLASDTVAGVIIDRTTGNLWAGLGNGVLNVIDFKKSSIETIKILERTDGYVRFFQDKEGSIWTGTARQGLAIIDLKNNTEKKITGKNGLANNSILGISQDSQGQLWIAAGAGLNMISNDPAVPEKIGSAPVDIIIEDSYGLDWDLGFNNGLDIINRKNKTTRHLGVREGLLGDTASQLVQFGEKMYIATTIGIDIIDRQKKTIAETGKAEGYNCRPYCIAVDKKGRAWVGRHDGVDIFDPAANTVTRLDKTSGFNGGAVYIMYADKSGRVWIVTDDGSIDVVDIDALTIKNIHKPSTASSTEAAGVFFQDKNSNMWIGTDKGLYILDSGETMLTHFSVPQGLIDERVASLAQQGNKIYVSTVGGLSVITTPAGLATGSKWNVRSFGKSYGLTKLNPNYGLTDALGNDGKFLWGDYGITVFDPEKANIGGQAVYISGINIMDEPGNFTGRTHAVSDGRSWAEVSGPFNIPVNLKLPHDQNYLQFNFATLNFKARDTTWYSYRLVGKDSSWSKKTPLDQSNIYFNLPPGSYTFEVANRTPDNSWNKPAIFSFTITPAWWQTWWAYILYAGVFAGIIWCFVTIRSRQLVKEKNILEHKVQLRTEEVMQQKEEIETQRDNLERSFTELKNAQKQLIQSEKMASLGELTAGIAHEIQNPLNFVNNFSDVNREMLEELKAESQKPKAERDEQLESELIDDLIENEGKINHHGKRADSIVKGMLEHSRASTGQKESVDLNKLADEYLRLAYHGLRAKDKNFNAELVTNLDENLPPVNIIPQDIGRVLLNLFNNAFYVVQQRQLTAGVEYKPTIEVTTHINGQQAELTVKDNGTGIPNAIKEKIMQPFFTTKPTGQGTGLGLSLSYDIVVKGHAGSIAVETIEGEGSQFIIKLPINN